MFIPRMWNWRAAASEKSQDELLKQEGNPESLRIFKELAALKEQAVNLERDEEHHKGGNAVWQGKKLPEGVLGGILTAQDISRLDLSGTELVVLSACQSGQGKVTAEGLFGLQRAFKKAGAQALVMTLWRVSDRVTREFMVSFYQHLAHSEDKRRAFEDDRQEIRARYPEPFYWAGFVMID